MQFLPCDVRVGDEKLINRCLGAINSDGQHSQICSVTMYYLNDKYSSIVKGSLFNEKPFGQSAQGITNPVSPPRIQTQGKTCIGSSGQGYFGPGGI